MKVGKTGWYSYATYQTGNRDQRKNKKYRPSTLHIQSFFYRNY